MKTGLKFAQGDRVRLNEEARKFGVTEASEYGTVMHAPKGIYIRILIDGGAEDYFHESFIDKVEEAPKPL